MCLNIFLRVIGWYFVAKRKTFSMFDLIGFRLMLRLNDQLYGRVEFRSKVESSGIAKDFAGLWPFHGS